VRCAILSLAALLVLAAPAEAQPPARPQPSGAPPAAAGGEAPVVDPQAWWDAKLPAPPEAADPLGERRLPRGRRLPEIANGVDPATYRLWGLMPLQWQLLHGDEMILEVWVRPARNVRQSVVRVTHRDDGRAFVQGRAGYACCEAGIGRRIEFDAELPPGAAQTFTALRDRALWTTPHDVQATHGARTTGDVCVQGVGYDLTLLTARGARSLHRACDDVAVGQVADVLEPVLRAALGHDPRFDVLYRGGVDFAAEREAYQAFAAGGGVLRADPRARTAPPGSEPQPPPQDASTASR
jgi:hypothetical protein